MSTARSSRCGRSRARPDDVGAFVAACSARLLRTANLLTHDHGKAEDLLQDGAGKTWLVCSRVGEPEALVRKVLVTTCATW